MKLVKQVFGQRLRDMVKIDDMQCGFTPRIGTTDVIFIVRQVQERLSEKGKRLFCAFVDLEKSI